jgi:hypothetical protein
MADVQANNAKGLPRAMRLRARVKPILLQHEPTRSMKQGVKVKLYTERSGEMRPARIGTFCCTTDEWDVLAESLGV